VHTLPPPPRQPLRRCSTTTRPASASACAASRWRSRGANTGCWPACCAGRIHSRDALLAAAWGDDSESTDRTVDTHVKTLRAKLREADAGREYITTHRGMGYCLEL
jgi:hypothetical protein